MFLCGLFNRYFNLIIQQISMIGIILTIIIIINLILTIFIIIFLTIISNLNISFNSFHFLIIA